MDYCVKPAYGKVKNSARVSVVGSKSITARALFMAALAEGESTLYGAQVTGDCETFISALRSLGISVTVQGTTVKVTGCGGKLPVSKAQVFVGSSGTAARFLTALCAFSEGEFYFDSSEQMKARPQEGLVSALRSLGAKFEFYGKENSFPFKLTGTKNALSPVTVNIEKSSQFLSALLMSAVLSPKPFVIKTVGSHGLDYVNMTLDMMWSFGVTVKENGGVYTVEGKYSAKKYDIEPDVSAACYFYAAARLLGADIKVNGVMPHTMQGDYKFIKLIKDFDGGKVDASAFSDQALTLAAVAPYLKNPTEICKVAHIRGQECDRINAIVKNLAALGVKVEEREDGVKIYPGAVHGGEVETFGDHRVAMAFSLCGLVTEGVVIKNAEVCEKTFADYFAVLDDLINQLQN